MTDNQNENQDQEQVSYSHCTFIPDTGGAVPDEMLPHFDVVQVTEEGKTVQCLVMTTPEMRSAVLAYFHEDAPLDTVLRCVYLLTKCTLRSWTDEADAILNPIEAQQEEAQ